MVNPNRSLTPWDRNGGTSLRRGLTLPQLSKFMTKDLQDLRPTIYNTVGPERWNITTAGFNPPSILKIYD